VASYVHGDGGAPDDPFGDPFATAGEGMTTRQIIDIVHPHLFTVPIVIFILGHLVHLTRLPDAWKLGVNVTAFTSFLATFLLPFAVVSHAGLAPLLFVSGCVFLASLVALCVIPLWEMWLGRPGDGFDALPKRGS
jgi:hypothetical protein